MSCLAQVSDSFDVSAFKVIWLPNAYYIDRGPFRHHIHSEDKCIKNIRNFDNTVHFCVQPEPKAGSRSTTCATASNISLFLPYCTIILTNPFNVFLEKPIVSQLITVFTKDTNNIFSQLNPVYTPKYQQLLENAKWHSNHRTKQVIPVYAMYIHEEVELLPHVSTHP